MYAFQIVTIFPQLFDSFCRTSLVGKAMDRGVLSIEMIDLRMFTDDRHRCVDDSPYGGGAGMVMKPEPVASALSMYSSGHKVLLSPQGTLFQQKDAKRLATLDRPLLLFCGRYEGVDERIVEAFDEQISIGDFVINGGEVAAMAIVEAVSRLVPGVIGNYESTVEESHASGLLEYPHYTRPEVFRGKAVPSVLLSGNHREIDRWRRGQSLRRTFALRPDLFERYSMTPDERDLFSAALEGEDTQ